MAVQFAQPYRFTAQQLARMIEAGLIPEHGAELVDGVPYRGGAPVCFDRRRYYRLGEIGVLGAHARVELIDGEIIAMSPVGNRHSACISRTVRFLGARVGACVVRSENPLWLPDGYDPVPDIAVLRPEPTDYDAAHPTHEHALLVVEVADSSVRHDRNFKAGRYAAAGIPEYWIADLTRDVVVVHHTPVAAAYTDVQTFGPGHSWRSRVLGGLEVPVDSIIRGESV